MSETRHAIQGTLFDLDGVVVRTDRHHYQAWKRLADEQGWTFDEQLNHRLRGMPRLASLDIILDHNGLTLSPDQKERLASQKNLYYKELLASIDESALYPGVLTFIEAIRSEEVKIGLCSASRNAMAVLERLDLFRRFDTIVTGDDFKRPKPDPEIFLLAAERLGLPPSRCVVFEDAHIGVEAALAAGMKVVGVGTRDVLPNAPKVIQRYDQIDLAALLQADCPNERMAER